MNSEDKDRYSSEEAQRRFEAIARAIGNTRPLRLRDVPRKRGESKAKARKAAKPSPSEPS